MGKSEGKRIYESLKSTGELQILYPNMTGDWGKDSKSFLQQHKANEELINDFLDDDDGGF